MYVTNARTREQIIYFIIAQFVINVVTSDARYEYFVPIYPKLETKCALFIGVTKLNSRNFTKITF